MVEFIGDDFESISFLDYIGLTLHQVASVFETMDFKAILTYKIQKKLRNRIPELSNVPDLVQFFEDNYVFYMVDNVPYLSKKSTYYYLLLTKQIAIV